MSFYFIATCIRRLTKKYLFLKMKFYSDKDISLRSI